MKRPGWITASVLVLGLAGCGDDSSATNDGSSSSGETTAGPSTSTGTMTTTGTTGSSTGLGESSSGSESSTGSADDTTGGSGGSESTGGNPACEDCLVNECNDELVACAGDEICACWLDCSDVNTEDECLNLCGDPSQAWADFIACYLGAIDVGAVCFDVCIDDCGACILTECNDEYDACLADDACTCWVECDDQMQDCGMLCGPPPAVWDAFAMCYVGVVEPGGTCDPVCPR